MKLLDATLSPFAFKSDPLTDAEIKELLEALQEDIRGISEWSDEEIAAYEQFMGEKMVRG